ncbi:hypothetical protein FisN_11Hh009 [Fistulifera solaris]|uniref:Calmodulin n=1 Tax=Fistulifera solaris TaxID=1519565 RepID=A0A1Z5JKJ7_FISSO|nr:hypothetical protein FisN_11Hh009 [Fistulifera solaris]|eukprot:GAX14527.1 hypothetical protein FisN_11Hh009 [Fistulifera solaris]
MGFSEDEIKEYQELYEAFSQDKDGNDRGYIEAKDFREYVRMIGGNPSEKKLDEWVKKVGKKIDFQTLLKFIPTVLAEDKDSVEDLIECFKVFDKDGSGFISIQELRHIYCGMGEKFSDEEFAEMAKDIDDGSGMVAYEDFAKAILSGA